MMLAPTIDVLNHIQGNGDARDDDIQTLNDELAAVISGSTFDTTQYDTGALISMFERFKDATDSKGPRAISV